MSVTMSDEEEEKDCIDGPVRSDGRQPAIPAISGALRIPRASRLLTLLLGFSPIYVSLLAWSPVHGSVSCRVGWSKCPSAVPLRARYDRSIKWTSRRPVQVSRPLDSLAVRALASQTPRGSAVPLEAKAALIPIMTLFLSLVVVLLGLLLTILIGEQGVRGVPRRAA
jgi:hypothetical protein